MKVWITKYALSRGIIEAEAVQSTTSPNRVACDNRSFKGVAFPYFYGEGNEWHRDEKSARIKAADMVRAKLASLDKQREKLLKINF